MSSAMRSRHLKRLGGRYGYGKFKGLGGKRHVGIERVSLISGCKEGVVTTSGSSAILDMTTIVRTGAAVTSASSSPRAEGPVFGRGRFLRSGTWSCRFWMAGLK